MKVPYPDPSLPEVVGQLFRHLFGEGGHQDAFVFFHPGTNLLEQVVDLSLGRLHHNLRVDEAGRTDDLLHHRVGDPHLVLAGRRRQVHLLAHTPEELLPLERAVVHRTGQAEAVLDEGALARSIPLVHRTDLRDGHVGLIDHHKEVLGEVVEEAVGRFAGRTAVDVTRVVLDAVAEPDLLHHLDVERGAHTQPLRFKKFALTLELAQPLGELFFDRHDSALHGVGTRRIVGCGENRHCIEPADDVTGERVQRVDRLDLVAKHLDTDGVLFVDRDDLDGVATHAELAAGEVDVVALVLHVHKLADQRFLRDLLPHLQGNHRLQVLFCGAEAVDAGHGRDNHDVAAAQQRVGSGVPQAFHLGVDRAVFFDERIGLGDVRLGLVVVVVGDEVLHRVVGHQLAELGGQLGGERFIVREHQRRALHLLDEPGGGGGLTCTGCAEQHNVGFSRVDAV